jgi:putative ABC transport system substrate-binding protein
MDRRRFLLTSLAGALAGPLAAEAQQTGKVYHIGFLGNGSATTHGVFFGVFRRRLEELGWIDGRNVSITAVWANGDLSRHRALVERLVKTSGSDIIVLAGASATRAAQQATRTIPIVSVIMTDPVNLGFAASLARPGGNVTGLADQYEDIVAKQMQLLKEVVPGAGRIGILFHVVQPVALRAAAERAARALGVEARVLAVADPAKSDAAFAAAQREHLNALHVLASPAFNRYRAELSELAMKYHLPALYEAKEYVEAGGLMSYGPDFTDMYRRAAGYVDRILRGAKPGDLPIEQPTKFDLVINVKTAKALGLTIPPQLLARADQVIE